MKRIAFAAVAFLVAVVWQAAAVRTQGTGGTLEQNTKLAHRYHLEVIQGKKPELAQQLFAPDAVFHTPISKPGDTKGPTKAVELAQGDYKMCPKGIKFVHEPALAQGNLVAFYWKSSCTTDSGEVKEGAGMDIVKIANGKVAEIWIEWHDVKADGTGR